MYVNYIHTNILLNGIEFRDLYDLSRRHDVTPELTSQNFEIKGICT